jgi:SAM-dependent methyltransferase
MSSRLRAKHEQTVPRPPSWERRYVVSFLAVLMIALMTIGIKLGTSASWLVVVVHMVLSVGGLSFLLILFAVHFAEPTQTKRRQFSIRLVLLAMLGLGMFLGGVTGISRLARFNPDRMTADGWAAFMFYACLLTLFGIPMLICLLESLVTIANAAIRSLAVRRLCRRLLADVGRRGRKPVAGYESVRVQGCEEISSPMLSHRHAPTPARYIHGTDASEQARLKLLNRLTNGPFVEFLRVQPRMRVLEVGSGLGILATEVAAAAEGIEVVGLERSSEQLAAAVQSPAVCCVQGDAHELPFGDGSFDLVYCRYLLEHVADPLRVLAEMRRVTRGGGRVAAMENDISLVRLDPPCPAFDLVWSAFAQHQRQLGGDGMIGRGLYRLFRHAGFSQVELSVQPEMHWHGSPGFAPWLENLAGNIRSSRQGLITSGLCSSEQVDRALGELSALLPREDASFSFVWNRAEAVR